MVCRPHQYTLARLAYPSFQATIYRPTRLYQQASAYATSSTLGLGYNLISRYSSRKQPSQNYNTSYFNQKSAEYNFPTTSNSLPLSAPIEFFKPPVKRIAEEELPKVECAPRQPSAWSQPKNYFALPSLDYSTSKAANRASTTNNPSPINRDQLSFLIQAELGNLEVQHVLH